MVVHVLAVAVSAAAVLVEAFFALPGFAFASDDMGSKQVCIEVPVDDQTISKYSLVRRTVDYDVARK